MPIPTCHSAVVTLGGSYPFYTQPVPSNETRRHLMEAISATLSFYISSISTSQRLTNDNDYIDKIVINFWSNDEMVYSEKVCIPKTWSPWTFLAAVYVTIKKNKLCSIESYEIKHMESIIINDEHFLFPIFFNFLKKLLYFI